MPGSASVKTHSHSADTLLSAERRIQQGDGSLRRGHHRAALAVADEVLAQFPQLPSAWLLRGKALKFLARFDEAAEAFVFILELFPDFVPLYLDLAHAYMALDRLAEAQSHLREAIARRPDFAAAHANLGSLYIRMDRYDLAEAPTRQALALDPHIIAAHQNLAAILALRGSAEAQTHRDAAYHRQQIFIETVPGAARTALIPVASGSGNVPYQHLLPADRYNRILWYIEYAPPDQARQLPPYDFVFNAVADPDAAGLAQIPVARFAEACSRPFINRPERVARTLRSAMPELIGAIPDVVAPNTKRFEAGEPAKAIMESGLAFPLILRPAGQHGGVGARLLASPAELASQKPGDQPLYATEFCDYRSPDGWYRKYRVIFVDRIAYPYHLAIGGRWLLHYKSADMQSDAARRAEEGEFLRDPDAALGPRAMAALRAIAARLDLDYAGIDFSLLPDGRLLFFEANATMLVHPESDPMFAYKNATAAAIVAAMDRMIADRLGR